MTYGIPRPTAIKGNVTIKAAKRGLNKRDSLCSTCIESTDSIQRICTTCEGGRIPLPMVTLNGFDYGINGTYVFKGSGGMAIERGQISTHWISGVAVTHAGRGCRTGKSFVWTGGYKTESSVRNHPTNRGRFTIDAQWPLSPWSLGHFTSGTTLHDSSFLNGWGGLTCRNVEYTPQPNAELDQCRECGHGNYGQPASLPANLSITAFFINRPFEIEMGARYVTTVTNGWRRNVIAGGIWRKSNFSGHVQVTEGRKFNLEPGVLVVIQVENNLIVNPYAVLPGYDEGWHSSWVGGNPNAVAVFHSPLPTSSTATDDNGFPLLQCFGKNLNLNLVAKSQQSDAMLQNYPSGLVTAHYNQDSSVPGGWRFSGSECRHLPTQDPPFKGQTTNYYRQINDFQAAGSVQLSTTEAIIDIFLGDDFAAEMEADASCTVTDG